MNDRRFNHNWHVALNRHNQSGKHKGWMYEGKLAWAEVPLITRLFAMERAGGLPQIHKQCSHSEPEQIIDNHLTCCFGVKCRECPELLALNSIADATPEQIDEAKAWTCAGHILKHQDELDTSEGWILRVDDRMFWDRVYENMAQDAP